MSSTFFKLILENFYTYPHRSDVEMFETPRRKIADFDEIRAKHDQSQAGMRAHLAQTISNSVVVPKIDNLSSTFSWKNVNRKRK